VEFGAKLSILQLLNAQCSLENNFAKLVFYDKHIVRHSVFYLMLSFSSAVAIS